MATVMAAGTTNMCNTGWHMPFLGFPMGSIFSVFFMIALCVLVYKMYDLSQQGKREHSVMADKSSSLRILEDRLAKGEISIEEFEKLKQVLQS